MAGRLVTFEGIDGSGKSTALAAVGEALAAEGTTAWLTREETEAWTGDAVRRGVADRLDPWATAFLFLADRAGHVPAIREHLAQGHVLCDRFQESTFAYQGAALGQEAIEVLREAQAPWCPRADHVILFDLPVTVALARAEARGATTPYEKQAFLETVREHYLALARAEPGRFTRIDASQPMDAVASAALVAVKAALHNSD